MYVHICYVNGSQQCYVRLCVYVYILSSPSSREPNQALRDFSTSLLLDDSPSNVQAYIHRGILYTQMKWYLVD